MKPNSSYAISKRVAQSTGISHCAKAHFTGRSDVNLVLARASVLQIYTLHEPLEDGVFPAGILSPSDDARLYLSFETTLFSNIQALGVVRLPGQATDALVLCFADAKVSVVQWDQEKKDVSIVSLHYFEKDAGISGGVTQFVAEQQALVDYHNRCACILIYDELLAVIPFVPARTQAGHAGGATTEASGKAGASEAADLAAARKQPAPSYLVKLPEMGITNIRDIKFLHGYYEPTIMVLYEPTGTWAGRLAKTRNTVAVAIIELDISLCRKMLIWSMDKLPHDAYRICPLRRPGGAILFCSNAIIFLDHSSKYRLSLNAYGDVAEYDPDVVGKFVFEKSKSPMSLDDAKYTFLSDGVALLSLETGALYFMTIITDGRSVTHIDLMPYGSSFVTTDLCTLNERYFFVAAKLANSALMAFTPVLEEHGQAKKAKLDPPFDQESNGFGEISDWCALEDMDAEVHQLLNSVKASKSNEASEVQPVTRWQLRMVDTLTSTAPLADLLMRPKPSQKEEERHPTTDPFYIPLDDPVRKAHIKRDPNAEFEVIGSCGYERSGAVCLMNKTMPHILLDSGDLPDATGVWSLLVPPPAESSSTLATQSNQMDVDGDTPRKQAAKRKAPSDVPEAGAESEGISRENGEKQTGEQGEQQEEASASAWAQHKVVLLTTREGTQVLVDGEAGIGVVQGEHGFSTEEETLQAGSVLEGRVMVQVCHYEVILVDAHSLQFSLRRDFGKDAEEQDIYAVWCSILDPFIAILLNTGELVLFKVTLALQFETINLTSFQQISAQSAPIATVSLFKDTNHLIGFNQLNSEGRKRLQATQAIISENLSASEDGISSGRLRQSTGMMPSKEDSILTETEVTEMLLDATEVELYSEAKNFSSKRTDSKALQEASRQHLLSRAIHNQFLIRPTYLALARSDGQFEIWRLNDASQALELVFRCSNLHNGRLYMDHENEVKKSAISTNFDGEICIASVGSQHSLPFLIVKLDDGTVYSYSCHYYRSALVSDKYLPIRFVRRQIDQICHNLPLDEESLPKDAAGNVDKSYAVITPVRRSLEHATVIPFYGIGESFNGFFVTGDTSLWLFCVRDHLRPQRVSDLKVEDGPSAYPSRVTAFCSLNTPTCPNSFIFTANGKMNIAVLDPTWDVERAGVCVQIVPLGETVHAVTYDRENDFLIVTTSIRTREMVKYLRGAADDKKEADLAKRIMEGTAQPLVYDMSTLDPRLPPIWEDVYSVKLLDPQTWAVVATYECHPEEIAKAKFMNLINYVPLPSATDPTPAAVLGTTYEAKQVVGPFKTIPVLVVGTSIVRGEDAACKGRIAVLDIVNMAPAEDGSRQARFELRCERLCLQPITTLDMLDGHLLTAEGRSFYVYQLRVEGGLYRIGFLDAQLNTVSVTIVRNYVLYGDIHHSIRLMRWLKAPHNWLQLVGKDPSPLEVVSTGALVEGDKATWIATDERGNLYMHAFTPSTNPEITPSLEPVGDFHLGTNVKAVVRFRAAALPSDDRNALRNHGCLLGGLDGSLICLLPVTSHLFGILKKLESHLVSSLEHTAGLHPFAFRFTKPSHRMAHPHNRAVLDGDLLWKYLHLERSKQEELARAVGDFPATYIIDLLARCSMQSTFQ